jgi:RimJ/RimL family protein N-acetyltransferase
MMPCTIEPETERLRLRQWKDSDYEPFARMNADPRVMEFFVKRLGRAASDAFAECLRSLIAERSWGLWAVELKPTRTFIGFVGLHVPPADLPFKPCVEIGWRLAAEYWGRGYATRAARAALRVGFEILELPEIVSFTSILNLRSQAEMHRLAMRREAQTFEHPEIPVGHRLREHCLYRLGRQYVNQRP